MPSLLAASVSAWLPELILSCGAMAVMLIGVWFRRAAPALIVTWLTLLLAGISLWGSANPPAGQVFFGLITLDSFSLVFRWLALGVTGLVVLMASCTSDVERTWTGEYLGLILFVGVGLMLMAEATHLLMAVVAIELVSLSSYCLVALTRDARSSEAALKYLLFGALSSGIMLFGISLLYGLSGGLSFPLLKQSVEQLGPAAAGPLAIAIALVLAGLAFKISMVPFHMWTPDVYEGAPIAVAALLSVGPKAAGLALLLRLTEALRPLWGTFEPLILVLTILTMTLGNVVALLQNNVKRLLAYSTIGQVGYLLIGFAVNSPLGLEAILVYLVAYLFMNLGAFACVAAVHQETRSESLEAFQGLAQRAPVLAFCCTVFLLSLAGIPPLLGFIGKFLLFGSALEARRVALAVVGVLNSAIALYYYVNIIRLMYLQAPQRPDPLRPALSLRLALGVCGVATVWLGVSPGVLLAWLGTVAASNLL